jgi:hypothetical protein
MILSTLLARTKTASGVPYAVSGNALIGASVNSRENSFPQLASFFAAAVHAPVEPRSRRSFACFAALFIAILSQVTAASEPPLEAATAGQPTPEPGNSGTPTVTVEGRREQEQTAREVRSFISSIAVNKWDEPLARWEEAVCPLVTGLPKDRGVTVFRRVSEIVADAGVPLGPRDCPPNLLIVATRDPEARLRELWKAYPKMMNEDRGIGGIERFIHGSQPIRAWHNACSEAPSSEKDGHRRGARCNSSSSVGSLLSFEAVRSIYSVVVVVDLERTTELDDGQLAGYAAMIALVQTRENGTPSVPTILRLFSEPNSSKPRGLSSWDSAFLKALYRVNPGDVGQVAEIAQEMQRQLIP